jgi:hypothetical protein
LVCGGGDGITTLIHGGGSLLVSGGGEYAVVSLLFPCMFFKCISTTFFLENLTLLTGHFGFSVISLQNT